MMDLEDDDIGFQHFSQLLSSKFNEQALHDIEIGFVSAKGRSKRR